MDAKIHRELQFLKAYALVSSLLFGVLIFLAAQGASKAKTKFDEIEVQRINIVEPDGKLRLTVSNNALSPGPILGGLYMKTREGHRGAGLIFFNDKGDECGGMTWRGDDKDGKASASSGLLFDQFNQDQTVGITYSQNNDQRTSGLHVWERSLTPIAGFARQVNDIESMKDGPEKTEAMKKLRDEARESGMGGAERVFVGRSPKGEAMVSLSDSKGKPRIVLSVDNANVSRIDFLDENGKATLSLPERPAEKNK